jgi:uncharacterized membrane protein YcjF (UPF0283 family)
MLSRNVRFYVLLLVSAVSIGIASDWIEHAIARRDWLGQEALFGFGLALLAVALLVWGEKWLRLASTDQDITPSKGLKK